jgi:hypothetical protein
MKPTDVSQQLRRIAAALDNSKNPNREAVVADLKSVVASLRVAAPTSAPEGHVLAEYLGSDDKPFYAWVPEKGSRPALKDPYSGGMARVNDRNTTLAEMVKLMKGGNHGEEEEESQA